MLLRKIKQTKNFWEYVCLCVWGVPYKVTKGGLIRCNLTRRQPGNKLCGQLEEEHPRQGKIKVKVSRREHAWKVQGGPCNWSGVKEKGK